MEFNKDNLVEFEKKFFDRNNNEFKSQRYGQALNNVFGFDKKFDDSLFYESDDGYSRDMAWLKILNLKSV